MPRFFGHTKGSFVLCQVLGPNLASKGLTSQIRKHPLDAQ